MPNRPARLAYIFQKYEPPLYFVTFNTSHRQSLLANESVHKAFVEFATNGVDRGVAIGRYVLMPDHVHLFARGNSRDVLLSQWMRVLKRKLSSAIPQPRPHWQEGFFDHVIRSGESYSEKWN